MIRSKAMKRYCRQVADWLPCYGKQKQGILNNLEHRVAEYVAENPAADIAALTGHFGTPQTVAAAYVDSTSTPELLRALRIRKRIVITVAAIVGAAALIALIIWGIHILIAAIEIHKIANGYHVIN